MEQLRCLLKRSSLHVDDDISEDLLLEYLEDNGCERYVSVICFLVHKGLTDTVVALERKSKGQRYRDFMERLEKCGRDQISLSEFAFSSVMEDVGVLTLLPSIPEGLSPHQLATLSVLAIECDLPHLVTLDQERSSRIFVERLKSLSERKEERLVKLRYFKVISSVSEEDFGLLDASSKEVCGCGLPSLLGSFFPFLSARHSSNMLGYSRLQESLVTEDRWVMVPIGILSRGRRAYESDCRSLNRINLEKTRLQTLFMTGEEVELDDIVDDVERYLPSEISIRHCNGKLRRSLMRDDSSYLLEEGPDLAFGKIMTASECYDHILDSL